MLCRHDAVHLATVRAVVICFSADLMLSVIVLLFSSQTLQSDVQNRKPCSDSQANCFQKSLIKFKVIQHLIGVLSLD